MLPAMRAAVLGLLLLVACVPSRARELVAQGDRASAKFRYEEAIAFYEAALAIAPREKEVRHRLEAAKVFLRQNYVNRIYDLVDATRGRAGEFVDAFRMAARLGAIGVDEERVRGIRADLLERFGRAEAALRARTEAHRYFAALSDILATGRDAPILEAHAATGDGLAREHVTAAHAAAAASQRGLALLHAVAAATFAPARPEHVALAAQRRELLRRELAIPIELRVTGDERAYAQQIEGALAQALPDPFVVTRGAPLALTVVVRAPDASERTTLDRLSERCQVATRREENPEWVALGERIRSAEANVLTRRSAVDQASQSCKEIGEPKACAQMVSGTTKELDKREDELVGLIKRRAATARWLEVPVYETFFYERRTVVRTLTMAGQLVLTEAGRPVAARTIVGVAEAQDAWGDGLSCAGVPADPLVLPALPALRGVAERRLVADALRDPLELRRRAARDLLGRASTEEGRLDALVRARLVDADFAAVREDLRAALAARWGREFGVADRLLR